MKNHYSRRKFLSRCTAAALGGSCALSTLGRLQMAHANSGASNEYKALVCVFLYGGNDAFNMVVPRSSSEYQAYSTTRQSLAVAQEELIPISNSTQGSVDYGLHPALTDIADLYSQNKLAVLANVGALVEPTSKAQYQAKSIALPPQLFSHNDQQNFVQSLQSSTQRNGWAGRAADAFGDISTNQRLSMNISLSGSNLWQSGQKVIPYSVNPEGVESLEGADRASSDERDIARVQLMQNILGLQQGLAGSEQITTEFPTQNPMASRLKMTAQLIAARSTLGVNKQTFFVGVGDFDTHGDQVRRHRVLMEQLNAALSSFYSALVELGLENNVTTFTASDFGRTLTSNGDGTDHGWGSHQLIMGGAVKGGEIYGTMPDLAINSNDDMGEGRIIPSTSIDQYAATLSTWFGLSPGNYGDVFPNLANFDNQNLNFI